MPRRNRIPIEHRERIVCAFENEAEDYLLVAGEMRTRLLLDALKRCIGVITAAKAYQWFRSMQTYLPRCINGEEIEGL